MKIKKRNQPILKSIYLLICLFLSISCSNDEGAIDSATLIEQYKPMGTYVLTVSPKIGAASVASGIINGNITEEEKGILRLKFSNFQADPMPFVMSVDVQFSLVDAVGGITIQNIPNKGFFDANPPSGSDEIDPEEVTDGLNLSEEDLENGLHSNGASKISGFYKSDTDGSMQFNLELDPAVGLPVVIHISTQKKI